MSLEASFYTIRFHENMEGLCQFMSNVFPVMSLFVYLWGDIDDCRNEAAHPSCASRPG